MTIRMLSRLEIASGIVAIILVAKLIFDCELNFVLNSLAIFLVAIAVFFIEQGIKTLF